MAWSLPDPPRAEPVLGDPASLAALALALRRAAAEVEAARAALDPTAIESRRHATRAKALRVRSAELTGSMLRVADGLADHSRTLSDAIALASRLVDRAGSAGLVVDGPTVGRGPGVQGVADPAAEGSRTEAMRRLQQVLSVILLDLDTARHRLRAELANEHRHIRNR